MSTKFPAIIDDTTSLPDHLSGEPIPADEWNTQNAAIKATQTKLGIGTAPASSATTGQVLKKQSDGTTNWAADADTTDHTQLTNIGTNSHSALDAHVASTSNPHSTTKAQVGLANAENTADSSKPVSTATQAALDAKAALSHTHTASQVTDFTTAADARITTQKGQNSGLASLDTGGKVPSSQLPAIALTNVTVVNSQTAQLALTAQEGDVAVRSDLNKSYVHNGSSTGTMADWTELATPTDAVQSVNGQSGSVTLTTSNVAEGTNAYYTESRVSANTNVAANTAARHSHSNKTVLDATDASFTTVKDTKLSGVAAGAEVNVNADWSAVSGDAQILNKPTLGTAAAANTSAFATAAQGTKADSAVQAVVAGTNVTVDTTDPQHPVIAAAGSGGTNITNLTTTQAPTAVTINSDTGSDAIIPTADATNAGVMSAAQQTKIAGIATAATANDTDANLKARANHTGTQTASTISDFSTAADARITAAAGTSIASLTSGKVPTSQLPAVSLTSVQTAASQAGQLALTTQEGDVVVRTDTNQTYMRNAGVAGTMADFTVLNTPTDAVTSVNSQTGAVVLGKTDVGLSAVPNVDATARANHTGTQSADTLTDGTTAKAFLATERTKLAAISGTNTGDETTATIKTKLSITTLSGSNTGDQTSVTGNAGTATTLQTPRTINGVSFDGSANITVADATKVPTNTTVNTKPLSANVTLTQDDVADGTTNKAYPNTDKTKLAGIATGATVNSTDAALLNRANHTGMQAESTITNLTTDLAAKAPLASPALTGTPTAPTATVGTNTTQLATTAFVLANGTGGASTTTHPQEAVINTKTSYLLDGFNIHSERWVHSSGGSNAIADGVMTLTTPASNDSIVTRSLWTAILQDFDTITFDVNFNGNTLLTAGDTPLLSFDQAGDRGIVLTNFATNGTTGWQTITLPLSKFTSNFDATSSTAGTGTHLDPATTVSNLKLRVYENTAGKTLSFRRIIVSDSSGTLKQDFTQPTLFAGSKPGSSFWRIQSLDIMKVTKDNMQGQSTDTYMANLMTAVKPFNPTHIAVSIPYDDPSAYPTTAPAAGYALRWATAIRAAGRNIFWRQMPLEWEGIYSKPKNTSRGIGTAAGVLNGTETTTYLAQIYAYIQANPTQYRAGDIICPIPEPENGGVSGVTGSAPYQFADANVYRRWLRDAITVTNAALDKINLRGQVAVGFYGTSGFIVFGNVGNPKGFLDERTLDAMSVLGMDDYPNPYTNMGSDLTSFENLYGQFPLMLTEWGTINETTDANRVTAMQSVLDACKAKPYFYGFNYWTTVGGTGNANENILDYSTLAPIGGYANLLKAYTSGAPQTVATHLATLTGSTVQINTASPPSARQALIADSAGVARFQAVTKTDVGLSAVTNDAQLKAADLDTDTTLAANSDTKIASQKAVKAYVTANAGTGGGSTTPRSSLTLFYTTATTGYSTSTAASGYFDVGGGGAMRMWATATANSLVEIYKGTPGGNNPGGGMKNIAGSTVFTFLGFAGNGEFFIHFFSDNADPTVHTAHQAGFKIIKTAGVGTIYATSGSGTTEQATDITGVIDLSTGADHTFSIVCTATDVKFYIDGTLKATHTTSIPANTGLRNYLGQMHVKNTGSNVFVADIPFICLNFDLL